MKNNVNYMIINDKAYFHHKKDGLNYTDPFISMWSEWKNLNEGSKGTVYSQTGYIFKFWIFALYFPAEKNESLVKYLARYKKVITQKGFKIEEELKTDSIGFRQVIYEAKKTNSVINDLVALQSFFQFIYDNKTLSEDSSLPVVPQSDFYFNKLDMKALEVKDKHSKGHAYGLKAKGLMRLSMANRITALTGMIKGAKKGIGKTTGIGLENTKAMPLDVFEHLLTVAPPERKLLYLLCATSPRIGQALHLTWFDVDQEHKRVFLVNPKSIDKQLPTDAKGYLFLDQPRRETLLKEKGIHVGLGPHSLIRWKTGEIPSIGDDEGYLFFIFDEWKDMFFETYSKVRNNTPATHRKNNPFVFQTSTGKRLLPTEADSGLKTDIKAMKARYPQYSELQLEGGYHLLRHMFGTLMASAAYLTLAQDEKLSSIEIGGGARKNIVEIAKVVTARKMGHSGTSSTDTYFNPDHYITTYTIEILQKRFNEVRSITKKIAEAVKGEIIEK